jgi:hypothetical protein
MKEYVIGGACSTHRENEFCIKSLVGNCEGKRELGRRRCGWENNIKMDLEGIECEVMDWTRLAQFRVQWWVLVSTVMNLRVP